MLRRQFFNEGMGTSARNAIMMTIGGLLAILLSACATSGTGVRPAASSNSIAATDTGAGVASPAKSAAVLPHCAAPLATVMIGKFGCKAPNCNGGGAGKAPGLLSALLRSAGAPSFSGIGGGLSDMLTTALKQTGCFNVQDQQDIKEIKQEMTETGQKAQIKPADYLIAGDVTSIGLSRSGGSFGSGLIPIIGSITHNSMHADLKMDVRLVDVKHASILDSRTFAEKSDTGSFGVQGLGFARALGGVGFGGSFSQLNHTPLADVAREAIGQAVVYIVNDLKSRQQSAVSKTTASARRHSAP